MTIIHLKLPGRIGHDNVQSLLQQLQQQLSGQLSSGAFEQVVADAEALQRFDSSALALLLALLRTAQQRQCQYAVINASQRLAGLMALYGVDALLLDESAANGARAY